MDISSPVANPKDRVKLAEVQYDKPNMIEAENVTITFNLEALSKMSMGADIVMGRMDRIKEDLAFIVLEKQARRAKIESPAGPIKIAQA